MKLSKTAKVMCSALFGLCAFFMAAGIAATNLLYRFEPPGAYAAGLLAGTLLSVVKVVLMEKMLERAADTADAKSAKSYGSLSVTFRNLLTIAVFLLVFFFRDIFGLFGAIIGVLLIQLAAFVTGAILRKDETKV